MPTATRALCAVALLLLAAGCVRSRHPELSRLADAPTPIPLPPAVSSGEQDAGIGLVIAEPAAGTHVRSPIRLSGRLGSTSGRVAVVQVLSIDADGRETRRGNAMLQPEGADGGYAADLAYTLDAPGPGVVEVVLVEPETGTVTERARVEVVLDAAPVP